MDIMGPLSPSFATKTGIKIKLLADLNTGLNTAYVATRTKEECVQAVSASDTPSIDAARAETTVVS